MGRVKSPGFSVEKSLGKAGPGSSSSGRSRTIPARATPKPTSNAANARAAGLPEMGSPVFAS